MRKHLHRLCLMALLVLSQTLTAMVDKYQIYPIPHSLTMNTGALTIGSEVNVVYDNTIDKTTKARLSSILEANGIFVNNDAIDESLITLRLGTIGSGETVEDFALNTDGILKSRIMVSNKFDRHAIKISANGITILGENTNAVFFALASLEQILEQKQGNQLGYTIIYDRADQQNRGLVEGYYGYPYSVEVKKDLMHYMMRYKMNTYMFGAKSDPYHSQMWKDAYPTTISEEQEKNGWLTQNMLRDLAKVSEETKVNFIWAIHPGNEFLGSSTVISDIMSKFEKMHNLGIRHFGVFVDDVSIPSSDADMKKNADRLTELQKKIESKWNYEGAVAEDTVRPLHFVPQIYCNSFASSVNQRQRFMSALSKVPSYITVYSTGQGVWSVPNNDHTQTVVNEFGRAMAWWWNYPCNDNADGQLYPMDMYSNFVDMPAVGDGERLPTTLNNCQGLIANPMQQGELAKTSLFSIADYAWNNAKFDNEQSWEASFKSIIRDEETRNAYHDITYYLRWNEPSTLNTLIEQYKSSFNEGTPNADNLLATIQKIKNDCRKVMTLKDSDIASDRLLYTDINPWLQTLHTYCLVTEKMISILGNSSENDANWPLVKEVVDSLSALENSNLYTAYALEGMGNGISVSERQAQLSRRYFHPFISWLKERSIDTFFNEHKDITEPTIISNSPLLKSKLNIHGSSVSIDMPQCNFDAGNYIGIALPQPVLLNSVVLADELIPFAKYSTNGKDWTSYETASDISSQYISYFILKNETGNGIKQFSLSETTFCINFISQAIPVSATMPQGNIYENHNASLIIDGDYNTWACLNRVQQNGDSYVIDLGERVTLKDVRVCFGVTNGDHPTSARIQYSPTGASWSTLKVKGTSKTSWNINVTENVRYSDEMVYCDFDGASKNARYIRIYINEANTNKWCRINEIEVNRQYAENSTLATCKDGNNTIVTQLNDANATTRLAGNATSPLTYSLNRYKALECIKFYSTESQAQPNVSITTDSNTWHSIGTLTDSYQTFDLQKYPFATAVRLEWNTTEAPAIYEVVPVYNASSSSLPDELTELAKDFALLKSMAYSALDSCGRGNKLITRNSQFSSPYTESSEGSINNLLDGKQNTYWHSAWNSGSVNDGIHYLEIKLPEGTVGDVEMHYGRRSDTDGHHLIRATILGVINGSGTSATTETVAELDLPYKSQHETLIRQFNLPKAYSSIRLREERTSGNMQGVSAGFFHIGELQLYAIQPYYISNGAEAEAHALMQAAEPLPSEASESDLQQLQTAYDNFMYKVFGIIPSGIEDINGNTNNSLPNTYYDLSGRKVTTPSQSGIYIINNKKVLIK